MWGLHLHRYHAVPMWMVTLVPRSTDVEGYIGTTRYRCGWLHRYHAVPMWRVTSVPRGTDVEGYIGTTQYRCGGYIGTEWYRCGCRPVPMCTKRNSNNGKSDNTKQKTVEGNDWQQASHKGKTICSQSEFPTVPLTVLTHFSILTCFPPLLSVSIAIILSHSMSHRLSHNDCSF